MGDEKTPTEPPAASRKARVALFCVFAVGAAAVAWGSLQSGVPRVLSPFPFLVVLPLMLAAAISGSFPLGMACTLPIPITTFVLLLWPITRSNRGPIPLRAPICLAVATAVTLVWFAATDWSYSIGYHGASYMFGISAANAALICLLWCLWWRSGRDISFARRLTFGVLLVYWLFWFAFPWTGELP
jgi:hypothetical protein